MARAIDPCIGAYGTYHKDLHILNAFKVVLMFTSLCAVIEKIRSKLKRKICKCDIEATCELF